MAYPGSNLIKNPRKRVPPLTPVPGVSGGNPLADPVPKQGFRSWRREQGIGNRGEPWGRGERPQRGWGHMDPARRDRIRERYRTAMGTNAPPPTFDNPITTNGGWHDPNSSYGYSGQPGDFASSPLGDLFLEENPDAAWMRHLAGMGIDPNSTEGQWARGQLSNVKTGWNAALASNPQLRQRDYLNSLDIRGMFRGLTADQRGENPGLFAPRARTISRGYG